MRAQKAAKLVGGEILLGRSGFPLQGCALSPIHLAGAAHQRGILFSVRCDGEQAIPLNQRENALHLRIFSPVSAPNRLECAMQLRVSGRGLILTLMDAGQLAGVGERRRSGRDRQQLRAILIVEMAFRERVQTGRGCQAGHQG
jgi:hypothetical protein